MFRIFNALSLSLLVSCGCVAQSYIAYTTDPLYLTDSCGHHQIVHTGKGDGLILPSLVHHHGMYKAIHIRSKKEGYVNVHEITIEKTLNGSESDLFGALASSDVKDPIIKVHNKSKQTMTVMLNQEKYEVEPHQVATIKVKAGKYHSKVLMEDADPIYCFDTLEDYKLYDWNYSLGK